MLLILIIQGTEGNLIPCEDLVRTCDRLKGSCEALKSLRYLTHQVNEALRCLDPHFYKLLVQLREKMSKLGFSEAIGAIDGLLLNGREILFNKESEPHFDQNDPQLGWAVLVAIGNFEGGDFIAPQLGIRTRFQPGDMILVRGRVVKHLTTAFSGQRISLPHFTHSNIWKAFDMLDLVSI